MFVFFVCLTKLEAICLLATEILTSLVSYIFSDYAFLSVCLDFLQVSQCLDFVPVEENEHKSELIYECA